MKGRIFPVLVVLAIVMLWAFSAQAYTINDPANDRIGDRVFETYGINVSNIYNSSGFTIDIFTNYPQAGYTVGSWVTKPADLFITEVWHGQTYEWAMPLVNHDTFMAGTLYAVGSYLVSDDLEPSGGGYTYNHGVPVQLASIGANVQGPNTLTSFPGGSVAWNALVAGNPDWMIHIQTAFYQDDPSGSYCLRWGTGTCANDVVVPIPPTALLLGTGLLGLVGLRKWRRQPGA